MLRQGGGGLSTQAFGRGKKGPGRALTGDGKGGDLSSERTTSSERSRGVSCFYKAQWEILTCWEVQDNKRARR